MSKNKITSNINILGGYDDFYKLPDLFNEKEMSLNERTISSSSRYVKAIKEVFFKVENDNARMLLFAAMKSQHLPYEAKMHILALQFYLSDDLFKILFDQCFLPVIMSGRVAITKHDIIAFLDEQIASKTIEVEWTRETIDTVSRKFLTILKKLGFLEGKVKKKVKELYLGFDFLVFFHYWLIAHDEAINVFKSSFFNLLIISKEKYLFLMKQPEIREKIDWNYAGNKFKIEPKQNLKTYIHELSN